MAHTAVMSTTPTTQHNLPSLPRPISSIDHKVNQPTASQLSIDTEDWSRFVLFPIRYPQLWSLYKQAQASFWTVDEVNLTVDIQHWRQRLSDGERLFISRVLAFFAASDGIVTENLVERMSSSVPIPEAKCFYGFQIAMENIHSETYASLITTLVDNPDQQRMLFSAISEFPSIGAKARWCMKWIHDDTVSLPYRVVAFAAVEGIFFSSSFVSIFWLKSRGLMPGLTFSNELISRDEALHTRFACTLLHYLQPRPSDTSILAIVEEAVNLEKDFVTDSLRTPLLGITIPSMHEYVEFVADTLLSMLQLRPLYHAENPFPFMNLISMDGKANFFERQVSEYRLSTVHTQLHCPILDNNHL
ncbi:hypothetical protein BV22DRAFT_1108075 [Leucogyrophana mollusca]|uniref:Uncharacterized protein n=1 Tax=Leucogyrophana mollusca TaxID=85980 RepID=A0ACB8B0T2_9AGAM|nr:hypothetical protein BV22DRAFT_1108075 [Leucogyrophana mollusca]